MRADIYWINGPLPGRLAILARPRGADWLNDEVVSWADAGVDIVVSLLTNGEESELELVEERELVQRTGLTFISFPIADYGVPTSTKDLRSLISKLRDSLACGSSVGIHCRQGIGRSSLIAACVLVMLGLSPEMAFQHISSARGRSVPDTSEQKDFVTAFANELQQDVRSNRHPF